MSTYATMQARIADELNRDDLSAQIRLAIKSAIAYLETEPLYFNEQRSYLTTTAGTRAYGLPDEFQGVNTLTLTYNQYTTLLDEKPWSYIEEITSTDQSQGQPRAYALYDYQLWVYPIPDQAYTLTMSYYKRLEDVSATGSANAWMNPQHGEEAVRTLAKIDIMENIIADPQMLQRAQVLRTRADRLIDNLKWETVARTTTGKVRPSL